MIWEYEARISSGGRCCLCDDMGVVHAHFFNIYFGVNISSICRLPSRAKGENIDGSSNAVIGMHFSGQCWEKTCDFHS